MEKLKRGSRRTKGEIFGDVYFKKIVFAFGAKADNGVPFKEIMKQLDALANKMARRIPGHTDRIKECITLFAKTFNESLDTILKKGEESEMVKCAFCENLTKYVKPYSKDEQVCDDCSAIAMQMRKDGEL